MNKLIVVVFPTEAQAYTGARALRQLDAEGSVSVYALGVIARDADGKISVKESSGHAPVGAGVGFAVGGLIGLLAGPVGFAVGAITGSMAGALRDFWVAGVGIDFVEETEKSLLPGHVAVIAEVEEDWVIPVDTAMDAAGGTVLRRTRTDVVDAQFDRDIAVMNSEIADLKAEASKSTGEAKAHLQARVDAATASLEKTMQQARHRAGELESEAAARIESLEGQLARARDELKDTVKARAQRVRGAYATRSAKLKQAWQLTREAIAA